MLWYKAWRESRMRFLLSACAIAMMCLVYTIFHERLYPGVVHEHASVHSYTQYIHWTIFGGVVRALLQLSCLLLGLGGCAAQLAALAIVQVIVLAAIPSLIVTAASHAVGQQLPLDYAARFIPLWIAGGVFTFAISFVASVLFSSEYVSLAVAYLTYIFYLAAARYPALSRFHLHVADLMSGFFPQYLDRATMLWTNTYALSPIVCFFVAGLLLIGVGGVVTSRQDL